MYTAKGQLDRDALIRQHVPLVRRIALHMIAKLPANVELDDLIQAGMIGLLEAARNYDGSKGASFGVFVRDRGVCRGFLCAVTEVKLVVFNCGTVFSDHFGRKFDSFTFFNFCGRSGQRRTFIDRLWWLRDGIFSADRVAAWCHDGEDELPLVVQANQCFLS